MATKVVIYCDRCGEKIGEYKNYSEYPEVRGVDGRDPVLSENKYIHAQYCPPCLVLFIHKLGVDGEKIRKFAGGGKKS